MHDNVEALKVKLQNKQSEIETVQENYDNNKYLLEILDSLSPEELEKFYATIEFPSGTTTADAVQYMNEVQFAQFVLKLRNIDLHIETLEEEWREVSDLLITEYHKLNTSNPPIIDKITEEIGMLKSRDVSHQEDIEYWQAGYIELYRQMHEDVNERVRIYELKTDEFDIFDMVVSETAKKLIYDIQMQPDSKAIDEGIAKAARYFGLTKDKVRTILDNYQHQFSYYLVEINQNERYIRNKLFLEMRSIPSIEQLIMKFILYSKFPIVADEYTQDDTVELPSIKLLPIAEFLFRIKTSINSQLGRVSQPISAENLEHVNAIASALNESIGKEGAFQTELYNMRSAIETMFAENGVDILETLNGYFYRQLDQRPGFIEFEVRRRKISQEEQTEKIFSASDEFRRSIRR